MTRVRWAPGSRGSEARPTATKETKEAAAPAMLASTPSRTWRLVLVQDTLHSRQRRMVEGRPRGLEAEPDPSTALNEGLDWTVVLCKSTSADPLSPLRGPAVRARLLDVLVLYLQRSLLSHSAQARGTSSKSCSPREQERGKRARSRPRWSQRPGRG